MNNRSALLPDTTAMVLEAMFEFHHRWGYWPSIRQLGKAVGWTSSGSVHVHLVRLEERGYVERYGPQHRYRPIYTR